MSCPMRPTLRRRRSDRMITPATATHSGAMAMLMTLSQESRRLMSTSRPRCVSRSSLRTRAFSATNRFSSASCSGDSIERGLVVALALQLGQLGFRLLQLRLQFQRLAAQAIIRLAPQRLDALEGPRERCAAAHADQRAAAAQIVENVGDEIAVVGKRLRNALTEHFARLHPHVVHQQVGVGDHDDVGGRRRLGQVRDRRTGSRLSDPAAVLADTRIPPGPVMRAAMA